MSYRIDKADSCFVLYENGVEVVRFTRESFRSVMESKADSLGRSSQWIGYILKIFNKQYPCPVKFHRRSPLESFHLDHLAGYLRSRGYTVSKELHSYLDDLIIIKHLESNGYIVSGKEYQSSYELITRN